MTEFEVAKNSTFSIVVCQRASYSIAHGDDLCLLQVLLKVAKIQRVILFLAEHHTQEKITNVYKKYLGYLFATVIQ